MWVRAGRRFMQSQKLNGVDVVGFTVSEPQSALRMQQESGCRKSGCTGSLLKDRLLPGGRERHVPFMRHTVFVLF